MRFVALRRSLWDAFEEQIGSGRLGRGLSYADVEELAMRYRQVLHDHAWARARFPGTGAARRLARLAVLGGRALQQEAEQRLSLGRFFLVRFPRAVLDHAPLFALALMLFLVTTLLGLAVAVFEPGVAVALLGPETVADLRQGHLWTESLTTTVPPAFSSSRIATNNMSVAVTAWAGGALACLGALWVVVLNGFLLGAVFGVTARYSMGLELLEFVTAHGPLEITLILVAAAAGLGMGAAVLRADDRPRSQVLPLAAREALVVLLGCLPWFLVLGLVEAFLSPDPDLPWTWKAMVGLSLEICFLAPVAVAALRARQASGRGGATASPETAP